MSLSTTLPASYGTRLATAVRSHGPLCVGIDPHPGVLRGWGLEVDVAGLEHCARTMVQAAAGEVALVKPQSAFFEAFGSAGIAVLERVLADCREAGLLSLLDVKRGDIGSTMDAYARAYLSQDSPLAADAVTLSPYLGAGSLTGAIDLARSNGRGVYLLAATSNPEAGDLQRARLQNSDLVVAQSVIDAAAEANAIGSDPGDGDARTGADPELNWGSVGVVVGATIPPETSALLDFSRLSGPVLMPGLGAQGAGAEDVRRILGAAARYAIPSSSRAVMAAGPDAGALTEMIRRTKADISATLTGS